MKMPEWFYLWSYNTFAPLSLHFLAWDLYLLLSCHLLIVQFYRHPPCLPETFTNWFSGQTLPKLKSCGSCEQPFLLLEPWLQQWPWPSKPSMDCGMITTMSYFGTYIDNSYPCFSLFQGDVLRLGLRYIVSSVVDSCSFQGMVQHLWISWRLHHWIVLPVKMIPWHDLSFWCHVLSYFDFQIGWWWTHDSLATSHQISMVQWRRCRAVVSVQDFIYASFNGVIIGNFRNCLVSEKETCLLLLWVN